MQDDEQSMEQAHEFGEGDDPDNVQDLSDSDVQPDTDIPPDEGDDGPGEQGESPA